MFIDLKSFQIYEDDKMPPAAWLIVIPGAVEAGDPPRLTVYSLAQMLALRGDEEELPEDLKPPPWGQLPLPQYKIDKILNCTEQGDFAAIRPYSGSRWGQEDQEMQVAKVRRKDLIKRNILSWADIGWLEATVYRSVVVYRASPVKSEK